MPAESLRLSNDMSRRQILDHRRQIQLQIKWFEAENSIRSRFGPQVYGFYSLLLEKRDMYSKVLSPMYRLPDFILDIIFVMYHELMMEECLDKGGFYNGPWLLGWVSQRWRRISIGSARCRRLWSFLYLVAGQSRAQAHSHCMSVDDPQKFNPMLRE
jgi:hypothetical protein